MSFSNVAPKATLTTCVAMANVTFNSGHQKTVPGQEQAMTRNGKLASHIAAQHAHVERFQDRDSSTLAPKRDLATCLVIEAHLRFDKD